MDAPERCIGLVFINDHNAVGDLVPSSCDGPYNKPLGTLLTPTCTAVFMYR